MNVRLVAEVISTTVSKVLSNYGPADTAGTAEFCLMFDKFFDIMNVSSTTVSSRELKPFNAPFSSTDASVFTDKKSALKIFRRLVRSIQKRPGAYTKFEKQKMFISSQTYEGLKITVHSVIELIKFLIKHEISYVSTTGRFCQDSLENYFGKQHSSGARKDNPSLYDFGYNDNTIRNQKVFKPIATGNVRGEHINFEIDTKPVPCRKKYKQSDL